MKTLFSCVISLVIATLVALPEAEAKRFGGGTSMGKQYNAMPRNAPPAGQTQQATPGGTRAAGAATTGASRWLGPLAGLAAGGLLASLFFGDAFEGLQIMDILLFAALVVGGLMLFRAMRRSGPAPAVAGAHGGTVIADQSKGRDLPAQDLGPATAVTTGEEAPYWFDGPAFLEGAKTHFIRLQAAWDQADFRDIRDYTTPQLFAELQQERRRLGTAPQYTEVVTLEAELLGVRRDGDQAVASILFSGLVREEEGGTANPIREVWHVQHAWESREGDWFIAGIQQTEE